MISGDWLKASKNKERKMGHYDVGYGKPPKHAQFKKGICPNPHGRGKRRDLTVAEILNKVLNAKTDFRERGKLKKASRIELSIRRFAALATKGDVASAAWLLKMRAHAKNMATPARRSSGSLVGSRGIPLTVTLKTAISAPLRS
jgi:uncharacterized protein DUF5681